MTGKELKKILFNDGWVLVSIQGSHHKFKKFDKTLIVPIHANRDLKKGIENSILKQAGLK